MKSCLFLFHGFGGGAETIAGTLIAGLNRDAFAPKVACMKHIPELAKRIPNDIPMIMPPDNSPANRLKNFFAVREAARKSDAVIGTVELQSIFFAGLFAPGKAIGWLHKDLGPYFAMRGPVYRALYTALFTFAANRCGHIACVSHGVMASCNKAVPASRGITRFMPNPVDTEAVMAGAEEPLQDALAACFAKPVILGVGRLVKQKAFHRLIEAHAIMRKRGVDHNLCLLGEGPERSFLARTAERLGTGASLFMPGAMNPYPAMKRGAALGLCSLFEGLPTVIVESMALGLPVVSMDCPSGPRFLLDEGRCGIVTPPGDIRAFAEGLLAMFHDAARRRYIAAALERASLFSLPVALNAWEELLDGSL